MTKDPKTKKSDSAGVAEGEFTFQAEVARLLQLMVNSVYSERDVFLRELISNAADACDKLRYKAITKPELLKDDPDLRITIRADREAGTLTIADNGIGMARAELIDDLGTIARSGTRAFLERMTKGGDVSLIGQFGAGFYSAFMAAERVDVLSRKAGSKSVFLWSSDANAFSVEAASKEATKSHGRGTLVTLHLKDEAKEYLDAGTLERFVRGVIDSEDMPLNISREMLQNNPIASSIAKATTSRVLSEIAKFAKKDNTKYEQLWQAFGTVLKEGIYEDPERRDEIFKIVRFHTSAGEELRSLAQYVKALRPNQTAIYYLIGDSLDQLRASPQLEGFRSHGLEVLLLADPVDNFLGDHGARFHRQALSVDHPGRNRSFQYRSG